LAVDGPGGGGGAGVAGEQREVEQMKGGEQVTALRADDVPAARRGWRRVWPDSSADCSADKESGGKACSAGLGGVVCGSTATALIGV